MVSRIEDQGTKGPMGCMGPDVCCVEELSYVLYFFLGQEDDLPSSNLRAALDFAFLLPFYH